MKQLGLVLTPLVLSILFGIIAWALTETAWMTTVASTLPIVLLRPALKKVREINQAEYRRTHQWNPPHSKRSANS